MPNADSVPGLDQLTIRDVPAGLDALRAFLGALAVADDDAVRAALAFGAAPLYEPLPAARILAELGITPIDALHLAERFVSTINQTELTETAVAVRLGAAPGPVHLKAYRFVDEWRIALGPLILSRRQRVAGRIAVRRSRVTIQA